MYLNTWKYNITREFLKGATRGLQERKVEGGGGNGGKIKWKLYCIKSSSIQIIK
jgi:hypothetical protein